MIKVYRMPSRSIAISPTVMVPGLRISRKGIVQSYTNMSLVVKLLAEAGYDCDVSDGDVKAFIRAGYYTRDEVGFHLAAQTALNSEEFI